MNSILIQARTSVYEQILDHPKMLHHELKITAAGGIIVHAVTLLVSISGVALGLSVMAVTAAAIASYFLGMLSCIFLFDLVCEAKDIVAPFV